MAKLRRTPTRNWRKRLVEACATIATYAAKTEGGTAHTVQLMLGDPEFRAGAIRHALDATQAGAMPGHADVRTAVDRLRGYDGEVI